LFSFHFLFSTSDKQCDQKNNNQWNCCNLWASNKKSGINGNTVLCLKKQNPNIFWSKKYWFLFNTLGANGGKKLRKKGRKVSDRFGVKAASTVRKPCRSLPHQMPFHFKNRFFFSRRFRQIKLQAITE
jgi:hypothetical protein